MDKQCSLFHMAKHKWLCLHKKGTLQTPYGRLPPPMAASRAILPAPSSQRPDRPKAG